jgi:hypothetical protein
LQNSEAVDTLAGLSKWSSPIVFDRLLEAYLFRLGDELGDGPTIRLLAYLHCQVWQALIGWDLTKFRVLQHNLRNTMLRRNLSLNVLELVDADIMSELLAVVMVRYRRSMDDAVSYHLALIKIAGHLKSTRYAAAPGR